MSTDGTHLAAALEWVKSQPDTTIAGQKVDVSKIGAGGFSMGVIEATRPPASGL
jgi:dienelactone hydrolase